ncbi:MAG: hypothetical protein ACTHMY_02680 [Solirubrobacteraceae bacterium]
MGRRLAVLAVVATGCVVASPAALARARPRARACGQVVLNIPGTGSVKISSVSRVSARRVPCARARRFVRLWHRLAAHGKLPNSVAGRMKNGVLVWYRWGRPYHAGDFVCRSLATPGPGPVQRELVTCGSPAGLVTWRESGRYG